MRTISIPREWTDKDIDELKKLKKQKLSNLEIANRMNRTEISIQIKWKRLNKKNNTYNKKHLLDKYDTNLEFINLIKPKSILDLYAGEYSYYLKLKQELNSLSENYIEKIITNDKNKDFSFNNYNDDSLRVLGKLYYEKNKFDLIDLDPFGSAYECFDLSLKMAKKGIIITYGELGHKRWKRLDFVSRFYDINSLDDFNVDNLIKKTQHIALQNKINLKPIFIKEWPNIARVYFEINKVNVY